MTCSHGNFGYAKKKKKERKEREIKEHNGFRSCIIRNVLPGCQCSERMLNIVKMLEVWRLYLL